ncbi:MAG TPA: biotin transporter BioY [candidate division Zixibacteria bacterium]|nr:biotin transporter BioY [candidate division Zixibacteria bacterium]
MITRVFNINNLKFSNLLFLRNKSHVTKISLAFITACLTGLFAQIKIYLPWTPIPITLQTLAVLGSGIFLGAFYGSLSQYIYLIFGIIGIPWFTGKNAGISVLFGASGGYLIGFIIASYLTGIVVEKLLKNQQSLRKTLVLLLTVNFVVIYTFGLIFLYLWFTIITDTSISFRKLLEQGMFPFIIGDLLKIGILMLILQNHLLQKKLLI